MGDPRNVLRPRDWVRRPDDARARELATTNQTSLIASPETVLPGGYDSVPERGGTSTSAPGTSSCSTSSRPTRTARHDYGSQGPGMPFCPTSASTRRTAEGRRLVGADLPAREHRDLLLAVGRAGAAADVDGPLHLRPVDLPWRRRWIDDFTARFSKIYRRVRGRNSWSDITLRRVRPHGWRGVSPPVNMAMPTISGLAQTNAVLSFSKGSWTGSPTGYGSS